jgi:ubiquinone biosynthesis protein COQ9
MTVPTATIDATPAELRPRLVEAMLPHVAFDGWSRAALNAGAADLGIPDAVARLAFTGPADMADAYVAWADCAMEATLAPLGLPAMKVRERIRTAVLTRLDQAEPHREAVRRAAAILAQPQNAARAARTLWRTVDAIWRACGDTSTDYNFYTKRAILAGVYSVTLLVWLSDESEGRATTHAFLDRRIAGIMSFEKTKARVLGLGEGWPSLVRFLGRLRYPAV